MLKPDRLALLLALSLVVAAMPARGGEDGDDDEPRLWAEVAFELPAPPRREDMVAFYVSATTDNRFYVDSRSLSVGSDGVVRYTLVVETPGSVRNVSFEGMRCDTRERRPYAFGRSDGSWSKARSARWERIRDTGANRRYAALFLEYFCPGGVIVASVDEARRALSLGGHPSLKLSY